MSDGLRALPSVDEFIRELGDVNHARALAVARATIDAWRERVRSGAEPPSLEVLVAEGRALLEDERRAVLAPIINATGVLLHTNLGRAPLGKEQLDAVAAVAGSYSSLEFDVESGARGSRHAHASVGLRALLGCEMGLIVNNNAAAVLVSLAALCADREVIISRGELIEIGGEFRIPDVMSLSRARLVEVGTTNRTHAVDYERAIGPDTAAILKVHPSNYKVVGFTASVEGRELARLAHDRGLLFMNDLGSGLVDFDGAPDWTATEPSITGALQEGADVVTFSGDKLFGGPQAGVIVGSQSCVEAIARHPLMRAVRPDKMTIAALQATIETFLGGRAHELPLWAMASLSVESLQARADVICAAIRPGANKVFGQACMSLAGGGSLPQEEIPSWSIVVATSDRSPDEFAAGLRRNDPPVIARIEEAHVLMDLRTIPPDQDIALGEAIQRNLSQTP